MVAFRLFFFFFYDTGIWKYVSIGCLLPRNCIVHHLHPDLKKILLNKIKKKDFSGSKAKPLSKLAAEHPNKSQSKWSWERRLYSILCVSIFGALYHNFFLSIIFVWAQFLFYHVLFAIYYSLFAAKIVS